MTYPERLAASGQESLLCLGLDPVPERLEKLTGSSDPEPFLERLLEALAERGPWPAALKPNLAYFEQYGSAGLQKLERLLDRWRSRCLIILDAKRGDIGPSSKAYARAAFEAWGADAVTVSPWLGWDSLEPFLDWCPQKGVYVLLRTSNPGAADLQDELWEKLAGMLVERHRPGLGAVVGATRPADLARVLELPVELPLLIPGVGSQGGDTPRLNSPLHRVNVSSAVLYAGEKGGDWLEASLAAARRYYEDLRRL